MHFLTDSQGSLNISSKYHSKCESFNPKTENLTLNLCIFQGLGTMISFRLLEQTDTSHYLLHSPQHHPMLTCILQNLPKYLWNRWMHGWVDGWAVLIYEPWHNIRPPKFRYQHISSPKNSIKKPLSALYWDQLKRANRVSSVNKEEAILKQFGMFSLSWTP